MFVLLEDYIQTIFMAHRKDDDKEKETELPEGAVDEVLDETEEDEDEDVLGEMVDDEKAWE